MNEKAWNRQPGDPPEEVFTEAKPNGRKKLTRRIICITAAAVALIILLLVAIWESQLLSDMTATECLEFVESRGVQIPDVYESEAVVASFVKDIIAQTEEDPNFHFCYNYTVSHAIAQEIQIVVIEYYGAKRNMCITAAAVAVVILLCVVISSGRQWLIERKLSKDKVQ